MKVLGKKIKEMEFQADVLSSQVSKILSEAILEGVLEGGQKLVEMEIQEMFGISRSPLREAIRDLEKKGANRLVFYGAGDLAEIAYIFTQGTKIQMIAVVDNHSGGRKFFNDTILPPEDLKTLSFDRILITSVDSVEEVFVSILQEGIPREKIVMLQ